MSEAGSTATTQGSEEAKSNLATDKAALASAGFTEGQEERGGAGAYSASGESDEELNSIELSKHSNSKDLSRSDSENNNLANDESEEENESDDEDFPKFGDTARGRVAGPVAGQKPTNSRPR